MQHSRNLSKKETWTSEDRWRFHVHLIFLYQSVHDYVNAVLASLGLPNCVKAVKWTTAYFSNKTSERSGSTLIEHLVLYLGFVVTTHNWSTRIAAAARALPCWHWAEKKKEKKSSAGEYGSPDVTDREEGAVLLEKILRGIHIWRLHWRG